MVILQRSCPAAVRKVKGNSLPVILYYIILFSLFQVVKQEITRTGLVLIKTNSSSTSVVNVTIGYFSMLWPVRATKLFNLLPENIRTMNTQDLDRFQNNLDVFLSSIPDQPTMTGLGRAAESNSLLHQLPLSLYLPDVFQHFPLRHPFDADYDKGRSCRKHFTWVSWENAQALPYSDFDGSPHLEPDLPRLGAQAPSQEV